ncbi:MAG: formate dehydrogenase accessory sulfurtransferase FdhD [Bacteroidota bacterium]
MKKVPLEEATSRAIKNLSVHRLTNKLVKQVTDRIVVEEPLEIRLRFFDQQKWITKSLAVTMRTPGNDIALALGFLFSEGIVANKASVDSITQLESNILLIQLFENCTVNLETTERNFYATSSCGICGKATIDRLEKVSCFFPQQLRPLVKSSMIHGLPHKLTAAQSVFNQTGGIHAAGLFSETGELVLQAEDVGRHNAVDKLLGMSLERSLVPLRNYIVVLSGRIGFELVQKTMMAGVPILAAVGAPSSLAVELAEEAGMTLIGFLRDNRFNVYKGVERIIFQQIED